jgi:hypothetical protein
MTTDIDTYRRDLLLALRLRDAPGPRIAEALAEVESHVGETGEDPHAAFGAPGAYADRLVAAWGTGGTAGWRGWVTWSHAAIAALSLAGGWLLADGVFAVGAGERTRLGLSGAVSVVVALALWAVLGALLLALGRGRDDRVRDPRTGADMVPPTPGWARAVLVAALVVPLLVAYVAGLLT